MEAAEERRNVLHKVLAVWMLCFMGVGIYTLTLYAWVVSASRLLFESALAGVATKRRAPFPLNKSGNDGVGSSRSFKRSLTHASSLSASFSDRPRSSEAFQDFAVATWMAWYIVITPTFLTLFTFTAMPFLLFKSTSAYYYYYSSTAAAATGSGDPDRGMSVVEMTSVSLLCFFSVYCAWAYLIDDSAESGRWPAPWKHLAMFAAIADYFPVKLKFANADAAASAKHAHGKYVFCYHPHGVLFWGVVSAFATEGCRPKFSKLFPGIDIRTMTVGINFLPPFFREINKLMGACKVTWRACNKVLERGDGSAILIIPGGAREAIFARPGTLKLMIKRRRGFLKVALNQGAALVPVLALGETDTYNVVRMLPGSLLWKLQRSLEDMLGITIPIFWGRKMLGIPTIMPLRKPIHCVMGRPIVVEKMEQGGLNSAKGKEAVDRLYQEYIAELNKLYDENRCLWEATNTKCTKEIKIL